MICLHFFPEYLCFDFTLKIQNLWSSVTMDGYQVIINVRSLTVHGIYGTSWYLPLVTHSKRGTNIVPLCFA